ncbi:hypothetical protein Tco_1165294 [Tanacetum coccineum]
MPKILHCFYHVTYHRLIDGSSCDGIDMVIKDLDMEPKINAMMIDFLDSDAVTTFPDAVASDPDGVASFPDAIFTICDLFFKPSFGVKSYFYFVSSKIEPKSRIFPPNVLQIKQSKTYQTFIALSTGLIPLKKSKGKGSKASKATITPKKKSLLIADDNIIPEPDVALELGKSISITEAEEQE